MSKVAILSDIHGNLPAFTAVLKEIDTLSVDHIVFGGDTVGYGASPSACVDFVRELGGKSVFGNHESYLKMVSENGVECLGDWEDNPVSAGIVHAYRTMPEESLEWIFELPWFLPIDEDTIIAHAGLEDPNNWPYLRDEESAAPSIKIMKERGLSLGFFGHNHRFAVYPTREPSGREDYYELSDDVVSAITVGSVGQPREHNDNRATWVLFDAENRTIECKRTEYDYVLAAQQIIEAGLPSSSAARLLP